MDRVIYEDDMLRIVQKSGETCVESASCDCNDLTIYFPEPPGPTPPGPTPTDCDSYIKAFETAVGHTFSPDESTYTYLCKLYAEAEQQFDGGTEEGLPILYKEDNFPNVYNYYYGDKGAEENAFATLVGWLFALQLAELKPKNRVAIFKTGYNIGGYTYDTNIYGWKFKADPNVARLVASGIYAAMRSKMNPNISTMRAEIGGSTYPSYINGYSALTLNTMDDLRNNVTNENAFYTDLREFMPSAPGPYDTDYKAPRPGHKVPDIEDEYGNIVKDYDIYVHIKDTYNLDSTDSSIKQATVQAIADKEQCVYHLFGSNKTVGGYSFHPVFGTDTIGKELPTTGNLSNLSFIMNNVGSQYRKVLLTKVTTPPYYGRLRPGCSWTDEYHKHSETNDKENELCNVTIEDGDGCTDSNQYKTYDEHGNFIAYSSNASNYCEEQKKSMPANSYPSGHSSGIWCLAMILMELMPEKTDKIMKAANQFAINRTITRWHWTSDTIMGRVLGSIGNSISHTTYGFDGLLTNAKRDIPN
jgi:hypothetical protein